MAFFVIPKSSTHYFYENANATLIQLEWDEIFDVSIWIISRIVFTLIYQGGE